MAGVTDRQLQRYLKDLAKKEAAEAVRLQRKEARAKAAAAGAPPPKPRLAVEDWESDELAELPARAKHGRRRGESIRKVVERLKAEAASEPPPPAGADETAATGLVVAITRGQCEVEVGGALLVCHLPKALALTQQSELAVGDQVELARRPGGELVAARMLPRTSRLSRPDPFLGHRERVIAANIDLAVVVVSLRRPPLSTGLVDRYLVALAHGGVAAAIAVNKADLASEPRADDPELAQLAPYGALEVPILLCSVRSGEGIAELGRLLAGRTAVLVGHSGVGKSSLLQALSPSVDVRVAEVSEAHHKGRHTTTRARIYRLPGDTRIIDTPGIREFGLWQMGARELALYFDEFGAVAAGCHFSDCSHSHEPRCAVRDAAERGEIAAERYATYLRILESLAAG